MSDRGWRDLERRYLQGDPSILPALNAARRRAGLPIFRVRIIHYLKADFHHALGDDGWLDYRVGVYGWSACGMASLGPRSRKYKDKPCPYTSDKSEVTCKTCLRCIGSPRFREGPVRKHLMHESVPGAKGVERSYCGGRMGGKTWDPDKVSCDACRRRVNAPPARSSTPTGINARQRRRLRRQQQFAFRYLPPRSGSQSDPFRHGIF